MLIFVPIILQRNSVLCGYDVTEC